MGNPTITYEPRPDATPEEEARALAAAYRFVLQAQEGKKKGARPGTPDDTRGVSKIDSRTKASIP